MSSLQTRIENEVAALGDLSRDELAARWIKAYGCPPPKGVKRGLLERAAAWHLQARYLDGLSPMARKAIRDAVKLGRGSSHEGGNRASGKDANADAGVSTSRPARRNNSPLIQAPAPRPGTRLVREWNGRTHVIDVSENGFIFDGKVYRSLSAVAKRITGAHWSGRRFFGL
ncbi:DUF2924 domain-containing protein [Mesorhizobium marinum]|uniref:DUF2924 domain-containing protein n=1 Tax=Mesorhizobium marinum TaxID=3228790 RepID=UPI0034657668